MVAKGSQYLLVALVSGYLAFGEVVQTINGHQKDFDPTKLSVGEHVRSSKVSVEIYVEALCIDSKIYMEEQVVPAYQRLGTGIVDFSIVSFGNAQISPNDGSISCQHGAAECDANAYQQCASFAYNDNVMRYLPFVACLFETLPMGHREDLFDASAFASCSGSLYWPSIRKCHDSPELVRKLQKRAASATPVDHTYVPWVVINGAHVDETSGDLVDMICDAYNGTATLCSNVASTIR